MFFDRAPFCVMAVLPARDPSISGALLDKIREGLRGPYLIA